METIGEMLKMFFDLLVEMFESVMAVAPKVISFCLWILVAIFIFPCVAVSTWLYPKWEKWGEEF